MNVADLDLLSYLLCRVLRIERKIFFPMQDPFPFDVPFSFSHVVLNCLGPYIMASGLGVESYRM